MAELAATTKGLEMHLEQVQDFTPTPMTVATEIYYSGVHPYTGERIFTATTPEEKLAQRKYFFWYDRTYRDGIIRSLHRIHREDLIPRLFPAYQAPRNSSAYRANRRPQSSNPPKNNRHKK